MKEDKKKFKKIEYFLALIISIIIILTLISRKVFHTPYIITTILLGIFLLVRIIDIIKKKGTNFWDYLSLILTLLFGIMFFFLEGEMNTLLIIISSLILLYSSGLFPTTEKILQSKSISSFVIGYFTVIFSIILLFAGAYHANNTQFIDNQGNMIELSFENSIYFSTTVYTSVGMGDINPLGINRIYVTIQAITSMIVNIGFIGYILSNIKKN